MNTLTIKIMLFLTAVMLLIATGAVFIMMATSRSLEQDELRWEGAALTRTVQEHVQQIMEKDRRDRRALQSLTEDFARREDIHWLEVFNHEAVVIAHSDYQQLGRPPLPIHIENVCRVFETAEPVDEIDTARGTFNRFVPVYDSYARDSREVLSVIEVVLDLPVSDRGDVEAVIRRANRVGEMAQATVGPLLSTTKLSRSSLQHLVQNLAMVDEILMIEVFNGDNRLIARSDRDRIGLPPLPECHESAQQILEGAPPIDAYDEDRGHLTYFVPVTAQEDRHAARPVGAIHLHMDTRPFQGIFLEARRRLVILLVVSLAALLAITFLALHRLLLGPLRKLHEATCRISEGDLGVQITAGSNDELGRLTRAFNIMSRNLDETTVSRDFFHDVLKTMHDGLIMTDVLGRITYVNLTGQRLLDLADDAIVGRPIDDFIRWSSPEIRRTLIGGEPRCGWQEAVIRSENGDEIPTSMTTIRIRPEDGTSSVTIWFVHDDRERRAHERRQKLLMQELDHRVKNNLASVVGLVHETLRQSDSLKAFTNTFLGRISSMARSHEALAQSHWDGVELSEAVDLAVSNQLPTSPPRIMIEGKDVVLPANAATPICLTLHELLTNATKHGALSSEDGRIDLSWQESERHLNIHWSESGGPAVPTSPTPGTGMGLIEGFVQHELDGRVRFDFSDARCECTIRIPLADDSGTRIDP